MRAFRISYKDKSTYSLGKAWGSRCHSTGNMEYLSFQDSIIPRDNRCGVAIQRGMAELTIDIS